MKPRIINLPILGRFAIVPDKEGESQRYPGGMEFGTNLKAALFHNGKWQGERDLGSGAVTNVGVLMLALDGAVYAAIDGTNTHIPTPSGAGIHTFSLMKYHQTGTGITAAAATDIKLGTPSGFGGQTPVAGTQVFVTAANLQKYQTVATISYTGSEAVTEWLLTNNATLTATTGTPFTAGTATTGTVTAGAMTQSTNAIAGQYGTVFENTGNATPSWGLVYQNSATIVDVPAWYKVSDGTAGATPANTNAFTIRGVAWDRKQFAAVNVNSGDSIQFTYSLTITSGG